MQPAFWLALSSGIAHALWNALAKTPGRERAATLTALILSLVAAILRAITTSNVHLEARHLPWLVLAGVGEAAYVFSLGMAYARGDLALTYTVSRATALMFIWPLSLAAFHTLPSWLAGGATLAVVLGIALTRKPGAQSDTRWHLGWTLLTGASVALYHTGYKGAVGDGASPVLAFVGAISLAVPLLLFTVGKEVRAQIPSLVKEPRMVAAGLLCAISFLLMLEALTTAESGRILGVRNVSVGFALLFALFLGERLAPRQWLGIGVLFGGVAIFGLEQLL